MVWKNSLSYCYKHFDLFVLHKIMRSKWEKEDSKNKDIGRIFGISFHNHNTEKQNSISNVN